MFSSKTNLPSGRSCTRPPSVPGTEGFTDATSKAGGCARASATEAARRKRLRISIRRWPFHVIDHQSFGRVLLWVQLQSHLFLNGRKKGGAACRSRAAPKPQLKRGK